MDMVHANLHARAHVLKNVPPAQVAAHRVLVLVAGDAMVAVHAVAVHAVAVPAPVTQVVVRHAWPQLWCNQQRRKII